MALFCGVCCEFVTFPLVSWVRCGTWLYRFLIFAPLLTLVATGCNLDTREVLKHPSGPLLWALFNCNCTLKKTNNSTIARHIERRVAPAESIPLPSACIIDGMSLVIKIRVNNRTFGDIAKSIFLIAIQSGNASSRQKCEDRGVASNLAHGSIVVCHKIQWWRRLVRISWSKTALIKFLCQAWKNDPYPEKLGSKFLFITCGKQCFKITKDGFEVVDEIATSQEEADTRTLLNTKHASSNYLYMVIVAQDTDVFIICLSVFHQISDMYIRCVTKTDVDTLTLAKLGSLLVKRLVKLYKDFMHSPAATSYSGPGTSVL